jgi:hypothetical protein
MSVAGLRRAGDAGQALATTDEESLKRPDEVEEADWRKTAASVGVLGRNMRWAKEECMLTAHVVCRCAVVVV